MLQSILIVDLDDFKKKCLLQFLFALIFYLVSMWEEFRVQQTMLEIAHESCACARSEVKIIGWCFFTLSFLFIWITICIFMSNISV